MWIISTKTNNKYINLKTLLFSPQKAIILNDNWHTLALSPTIPTQSSHERLLTHRPKQYLSRSLSRFDFDRCYDYVGALAAACAFSLFPAVRGSGRVIPASQLDKLHFYQIRVRHTHIYMYICVLILHNIKSNSSFWQHLSIVIIVLFVYFNSIIIKARQWKWKCCLDRQTSRRMPPVIVLVVTHCNCMRLFCARVCVLVLYMYVYCHMCLQLRR